MLRAGKREYRKGLEDKLCGTFLRCIYLIA